MFVIISYCNDKEFMNRDFVCTAGKKESCLRGKGIAPRTEEGSKKRLPEIEQVGGIKRFLALL